MYVGADALHQTVLLCCHTSDSRIGLCAAEGQVQESCLAGFSHASLDFKASVSPLRPMASPAGRRVSQVSIYTLPMLKGCIQYNANSWLELCICVSHNSHARVTSQCSIDLSTGHDACTTSPSQHVVTELYTCPCISGPLRRASYSIDFDFVHNSTA